MECSICLEKLNKNNENCEVQPFLCIHKFHKQCIEKWSGSCPNCRICRKESSSYLKYHCMSNNAKRHLPETFMCRMHNIFVAQSHIPPFGAVTYCQSCNNQSFHNMNINYFIN